MSKIVNLNFQLLINGWEIEVVENGNVIEFSSEELESGNEDSNYVSLKDLLSDMSYEDNQDFWDAKEDCDYDENDYDESDYDEELEVDDEKVERIVKDFFKDETIEVNIERTSNDT